MKKSTLLRGPEKADPSAGMQRNRRSSRLISADENLDLAASGIETDDHRGLQIKIWSGDGGGWYQVVIDLDAKALASFTGPHRTESAGWHVTEDELNRKGWKL